VPEQRRIPREVAIVAERLGALRDKVVFVGGAIAGLLLTDAGAPEIRPTDDVDVIAEITSMRDYYELEDNLRSIGFRHRIGPDEPICRWEIDGIIVDVMPQQGHILGFSNQWYPEATKSANQVSLPSGAYIRLISPPYFLATKLDAFHDRGHSDYRGSHDMEDVVVIIDGRSELADEIAQEQSTVKTYIATEIAGLLADGIFIESISAHLLPDPASQARITLVIERMRRIAKLAPNR